MPRYNKILFPTDHTIGSKEIAKHVREIADKFGSEIHIIFVAHVKHYYEGIYNDLTDADNFEGEVVRASGRKLRVFANEFFHDDSVILKVIIGHPGEEILNYAKSEKTDLIIMGHSRTGIKRLMLGSVAGHVVKKSQVPVMIV